MLCVCVGGGRGARGERKSINQVATGTKRLKRAETEKIEKGMEGPFKERDQKCKRLEDRDGGIRGGYGGEVMELQPPFHVMPLPYFHLHIFNSFWGSTPDPDGGAYSTPPLAEGGTLLHYHPRPPFPKIPVSAPGNI